MWAFVGISNGNICSELLYVSVFCITCGYNSCGYKGQHKTSNQTEEIIVCVLFLKNLMLNVYVKNFTCGTLHITVVEKTEWCVCSFFVNGSSE